MKEAAIKRIKQPKEIKGHINIKRIGLNEKNRSVYRWECKECHKQTESTIDFIKKKRMYFCCYSPLKIKKAKVIKTKQEYKTPLGSSGFYGVSKRDDKGGLFMARVTTKTKKQKFLGYYKTAIEAAIVRDRYIIDYNIEAKMNNVIN